MQSEPKSQGHTMVLHVSGLLVALGGHLFAQKCCMFGRQKRYRVLSPEVSVPFQSLFDYICCDVDGFL